MIKSRLFNGRHKFLSIMLFTFMLSACEGEISTNRNAYGDEPSPVTNDRNNNDDFFHASRVTDSSTSDSLSADDTVDYFYYTPGDDYRSHSFELTGLTGDADMELFSAYSKKLSWSENPESDSERIDYWRGYAKGEGDIVYIKVINRSGTGISYNLEINQ